MKSLDDKKAKLRKGVSPGWKMMMVKPSTPAPAPVPAPAPAPPPAPPPRVWTTTRDGDGSVSLGNDGTLTANIQGPNDSGGAGWSAVYSLFTERTTLTFTYNWFTSDGINYDFPFIFETPSEPSSLFNYSMANYRNSIVFSNSQSGTHTFNTSGGTYVCIGVYSTDSCCGNGQLQVRGLPV